MKRRLNTEIRNRVFSLSANGVGGEDRGAVARETQIRTRSLSALGRGEGESISHF